MNNHIISDMKWAVLCHLSHWEKRGMGLKHNYSFQLGYRVFRSRLLLDVTLATMEVETFHE